MAQTDSFRWDTLGNPDFSQTWQWLGRFPQELRNLMNRSEEQVCIGVLFFAWVAGFRAGRQTNYCSFSQDKLGEQFGRSRWTVARAVENLEKLGLIHRLHRRPVPGGTWRTNLYLLQPKLLRLLTVILKGIRGNSPCSKNAPQVASKTTKRGDGSFLGVATPQERIPDDEDDTPGPSFLQEFGHLFNRPATS